MVIADKEFRDLFYPGAPCIIKRHDTFWHGRILYLHDAPEHFNVEVLRIDCGEIKYLQGAVTFCTLPIHAPVKTIPVPDDGVTIYPDAPSVRALIELYLRLKGAMSGSGDPWGWGG